MFKRGLLNRQPQRLAQSQKQLKSQRRSSRPHPRVRPTRGQSSYSSEDIIVVSPNTTTTGSRENPSFQHFARYTSQPGQLCQLNPQNGYLQILALSTAPVGGSVDEQKMFFPLLTSIGSPQAQLSPWVYSAQNVERWNAALTPEVLTSGRSRVRRPRFILPLRLNAKERAMFNWVRYYGPHASRKLEATSSSHLEKMLPDVKALQVVYVTGSLLQRVVKGGWWMFWGTLTYPIRRVGSFLLFFSDLMILQGKGTFRYALRTLYHDWIWHCGRSRTSKLREAVWVRVVYTWYFLTNRWAPQSYEYALNGLNTPRILSFLLPIVLIGWGFIRASTELSLTRGPRVWSLHEGWTARPMTLDEQDVWTSVLASKELQLTTITSTGQLKATKQTIWKLLEPEELLILEPKHTGMDEQLFMPQRVLGIESLTQHQVFEKLRGAELDWSPEQQWDETHWSQEKLSHLTAESYTEEVESDVIALLDSGLFEERLGRLDPANRPLLRAVDHIGAEDDEELEEIELGEEDDETDEAPPRRKRTKLIGESLEAAETPLPAFPDSPPKVEKLNADFGFPCFTADGKIYHTQFLWPACRLGVDSLEPTAPRHFDLPPHLTKKATSSFEQTLLETEMLEKVPATSTCDALTMLVEPTMDEELEELEVETDELAVIPKLHPSSRAHGEKQVQVQLKESPRQLFSNYPQARVGTDVLAQAVPSSLQDHGLSQWTVLPPYSLSSVDILEQLLSGHALQDLPAKINDTNPQFFTLGSKDNTEDLEEYLEDQDHRVGGSTEFHAGLEQIDGVQPVLSDAYIIDTRPGLLKYLPSLEECVGFPRPMSASFDSTFSEEGFPLESKLESKEESKLASKLESKEESELDKEIESELESELEDELEDELDDELEDELEDELDREIHRELESEEDDDDNEIANSYELQTLEDSLEEEEEEDEVDGLNDSPYMPIDLRVEDEYEWDVNTDPSEFPMESNVEGEDMNADFAVTLRDRYPQFYDSPVERSPMDEDFTLPRYSYTAVRAVENKVIVSKAVHIAFKLFELALIGVCYRVWLTGFIKREDPDLQIQNVLWHVGRSPKYRASYGEVVGIRSSKMGLYQLILGFQNYRLRMLGRPSELIHQWETLFSPLIPRTMKLRLQRFWTTQYTKVFPPKLHSFRMLEQVGVEQAVRLFYTHRPATLPTSAYFVRRPRQVRRRWAQNGMSTPTWGPRIFAAIESDLAVRIPREFAFSLFHGLIHPNPTQLLYLPRGLVISGIIGNGDGFIARAVASETRQPLFRIESNRFLDPMNGVDKLIELFEYVRREAPNIVYFDTLELLAKDRQLTTSTQAIRLTNQFLICLDGFNSGSEAGPTSNRIFIMAATQSMAVIDRACLRSGRFEWVLEIGFPRQGERIKLFRMYTARTQIPVHVDLNWKYFALLAEGYTCSQIRAVILGSLGKFTVGQTLGGHSDSTFFHGMHQANRLMAVFGDELVKAPPIGLFEQAATVHALLPQRSKEAYGLESRIPANTLTLVLGLVFLPSLWGPQPLSAKDVYVSTEDFLLTSCLLFTSEVFLLKRATPAWKQAGLRLSFDTYVESLGQRIDVDFDRTMRPYLLDQLFAPSQQILPIWIEEWFDMLVPPLEVRDRENICEVLDLDVVREDGLSRTKTLDSWLYTRTFYDGLYPPATVDLTSYLPLSILPYANVNAGFDLFTEWTSLFGAELGLSFPGTYLDYPHIRASYGTQFFRLQFRRPIPQAAYLQDPYVFIDQPTFTSTDSASSELSTHVWEMPKVDTPKQDTPPNLSINFDANGDMSVQGINLMGQYNLSTSQMVNEHDLTSLGFDVDLYMGESVSSVLTASKSVESKKAKSKPVPVNGMRAPEATQEQATETASLSQT